MTSGKNSKNENDDVGYAAAGLVGLTLAFGPAAVIPAAAVGATIGFFGQLLFSKDEEINDEFKKDVEKYFSSIDLTEELYSKAFDLIKNELNNKVNHQSYYYYGKLYLALFYNYLGNDIYGKHNEREVAFYLLAILNKYNECEIKNKEFNYNELYISLINNYLVNEVYKVNDFKKLKLVKNNKNQYSNEIKNIVINTSKDYPINIVCLSSYMLSLCNILDKFNFEYKKDIIIFLFNKIIYEIYKKELNYQEVLIYINNYENFIKTYLLDKENKNKKNENNNNKTSTNENVNSDLDSRTLRLHEERNALIKRIRAIIKNKKYERFKKNIGSLYSQVENLDKEIAFIKTAQQDYGWAKYSGDINTLDRFNHVRSNFEIEYKKYLDDLQKKIAFEQEQKKLKAHRINIERQKLELKQRKKIEFKKKIKVKLANEIEKNFKFDYMFNRFKEIDNLIKTKVYNNKLSKKIAEVIEESYRSRFNEFLLDEKMMPIHEDVAIKISNLINECSTGELKEFIPFEKVDNFFNYKNEVFNNYFIWRKELIRFNKRKEIKYQVTHDVQVNDQRDEG